MEHSDIILATANARFSHPAFGLRYILANLGRLQSRAAVAEYLISDAAEKIAGDILEREPRVVGLGVYIWNVTLLTEVARILKDVRPEVALVLGGPEVSHEYEGAKIFDTADYVIRGEGEDAFRALARQLLDGNAPAEKVIGPHLPDLSSVAMPYGLYTGHDLNHRLTYVESSRGCPFRCAFCLSSLDARVREFPLEDFLEELGRLIERGATRFKFVDRTFNLRAERVARTLRFILERWHAGMQVHFEIVPDRLDDGTLAIMKEFPPMGLRLEAGVQTLNPASQQAIDRKQDTGRTMMNLRLMTEMGALVHADLVAGLPYETWETFGAGFDQTLAQAPHEMQVGILKRLKGSPIAATAPEYGLVFNDMPPYEILCTPWMREDELCRIKRMARYFEIFYNSGNFPRTVKWLMRPRCSAFQMFIDLSDALWAHLGRTYAIPLVVQAERLFDFLRKRFPEEKDAIAEDVEADFRRVPGRRDKLWFLR